ncbi:hypothetical protein LAUMK4_03268 [Mycobacterium persicum]|uniref:Uncharacterized protein n=1 Tax=Mycobacterium persicum TaxID=1487726 RepID=A0AB38UVC2_9MYCO|nr:hypothetical protein LAUMK15_03578 [Mycobacterium persicum]VAZ84495.1 hypothetical protein LAUMK42_03318 [Mycobacterium persicum]VAZ95773.1 hypothetical protein LAUMK4_03268 [Mycobacterium persicum]
MQVGAGALASHVGHRVLDVIGSEACVLSTA